MRKFAKKITAAALSLGLVFAVSTTCLAEAWQNYYGADQGWNEGASGTLENANTFAGFTAKLEKVGYGGIWGAQVFLTEDTKLVNIKKGETYTINFTAKSSNVNKYIYVKIATDEVISYATWVKIPAGSKGKKVSRTFKAKVDAKTVYFGLGGEFGDRTGVDEDAEIRYAIFKKDIKAAAENELPNDADGDPDAMTDISITNFSIIPQTKISSAKSPKKNTVKVKVKKSATGIKKSVAGYQFKIGSKKVYKTKPSVTLKNKKFKSGKKVSVRVRAYAKGKKFFGPWSKAKKVKVK